MEARLAMPLLAVLALLAVGCGGSGPDETVRDYFGAIVEQDGERACEQLTPQLRREIERAPAVRVAGRGCAEVMELAAGLNPQLGAADVEGLDIEVEADGDRAVARLVNPFAARKETLDLIKVEGDWKISSLETRPTDPR